MRVLTLLALLTGCTGVDKDTSVVDPGDEDGDTWTVAQGDCDDADAAVNPDATEVWYDGVDQDCDGNDDDQDLDGYGQADDCADTDPAIHPGVDEIACDGIDQDCDGVDLTFGDGVAWADADGDGYGDPLSEVPYCGEAPPEGAVLDATDCDDTTPTTFPGAPETCNQVDDDCDGTVDEDPVDPSTFYADVDADGYGDVTATTVACTAPEAYVADATDCDDTAGSVHPGASEVCNLVDDDCDGTVDEDAAPARWYLDTDGDGYGESDVYVDDCGPLAGYASVGGDCDDTTSAIAPDVTERCNDIDDNCDGVIDTDAVDARTWYPDEDGDGYGATTGTVACDQPADTVTNALDCDDGNATLKPGAPEVCDGIDEDCDGAIDEAGSIGETTFYEDADGDGYGDSTSAVAACDAPPGYVSDHTDCDDTDAGRNPGLPEVDNLVDDDCDTWVDEDFLGFGSIVVSEVNRQPRFGGSSTVDEGMWFEVYNPSTTRTVDLSGFYVIRYVGSAFDAFIVDPDGSVVLAPGDYAVFCSTSDYEASAGAAVPLGCDYIWGDPTRSSTYEGTYHDNTFNLQRDEDVLALYVEGGTSRGTLVDSVHWTYDSTDGYWPRDGGQSMALDPSALDASANDDLTAWCSTSADAASTWWTDGTSSEYGTPGEPNGSCP